MAANTEHKQEQDYQVIQQQIVRKRKPKWKKRVAAVCSVVCLGVIFGLVARYVFLVSDELLIALFGLETEKKQEVHLSEQEASTIPTPSLLQDATITPTPKEVLKPTKGPSQIPNHTPVKEEEAQDDTSAIGMQLQFYEEIATLAHNVKKSFVIVTSIESGVDWFEDTYETRKDASGLLLGSNGIEFLILVNLADIQNTDLLEVTLADGTVCKGTLYAFDSTIGLAVIGVKQEAVSDKQKATMSFAHFAPQSASVGMPVLALGILNDHEDAIEYGMVTSADGTVSVVDGELSYYTTNIPEYVQASGFLVNLKGEIVGMLTHTMRQEQDEAVLSAVSITKLQGIIQKLLNRTVRSYCGLKISNIPESVLEREQLKHGIYVIGVELNSPALHGGIQSGDMITAINGEDITSVKVFEDKLLHANSEEAWTMTIIRGTQSAAKTLQITVTLEQKRNQ